MRKARYIAPWQRAGFDASAAVTSSGAGRAAGERSSSTVASDEIASLSALAGKPAIYHCVSRIVNREFVLGEEEKNHFVELMRLYEKFCQVKVLTFCVMSNHFHILLEVPARPRSVEEMSRVFPDDAALLKHLEILYSDVKVREVARSLAELRGSGRSEQAEALRESFLRRMWDLSSFMKTVKQRFTQWFNRQHGRRGVLWEDRFKSVLVEDGHAARVMAAYIDLNPVRAKMVEDAREYRWSGYGEAVSESRKENRESQASAREGLSRLMMEFERRSRGDAVALANNQSWLSVAMRYRNILLRDAKADRADVSENEQRMSEGQMLYGRVRYFVDGMVVGTRGFVERAFELSRGDFGEKRQSGARKLRSVKTELRTMRDLQGEVYRY